MSEATNYLQVRLDAITRGLSYDQAQTWLAEHPDATGKELLAYLGELADEVREKAIQIEMASCKLDRIEASMLVDKYMSYRSVLPNRAQTKRTPPARPVGQTGGERVQRAASW